VLIALVTASVSPIVVSLLDDTAGLWSHAHVLLDGTVEIIDSDALDRAGRRATIGVISWQTAS
jgi:hypothetical protein